MYIYMYRYIHICICIYISHTCIHIDMSYIVNIIHVHPLNNGYVEGLYFSRQMRGSQAPKSVAPTIALQTVATQSVAPHQKSIKIN